MRIVKGTSKKLYQFEYEYVALITSAGEAARLKETEFPTSV
jgi:hypothetical protein